MTLDAILAGIDTTVASLVIMVVIVIAVVASWHRNKEGFDLSTCIVETATGKVSPEKVGYMTALAMMSWGFAALVLQGKLTEWYAGLFAGIFVMGRVGLKYVDKKDAPNANPPA
jgi:hypothetical protein